MQNSIDTAPLLCYNIFAGIKAGAPQPEPKKYPANGRFFIPEKERQYFLVFFQKKTI